MALEAMLQMLLLAVVIDIALTECSVGCTSCSDSTCLSCESSYYLSSGFCSPCPEDCSSCNTFDDCTSCKATKFGLNERCIFDCHSNCLNGECQDHNGYCVQCKHGLYGLQCQYNCSYCANELCDLKRCTQGCIRGYFEYKTEFESLCQKCPTDCRSCNDASTCNRCNDEYQLYQFRLNGNVFVHCISCSLGSNCSNYCIIDDCYQCQIQEDALVCTDCPEGQRFNGSTCILNTTSCSEKCSQCDDDGICLGNCIDGWTGDRCSEMCSDKCLTCEKSNDNICLQCKGDYYTNSCSATCNPSCTKNNGKQTCRLVDGYCLNGCDNRFWGHFCNQPCSEGCADSSISLSCERSNGTCINGCKVGYTGDKCDVTDTSKLTGKPEGIDIKHPAAYIYGAATATTTTTQTQICAQSKGKENGSNTDTFIVGFFSGLGTSIIVAAITVTFYQLRRRYIARKLTSHRESNHTAEMPTYYNDNRTGNASATREPTSDTNSYERLGRSTNTDQVYSDLETTPVQQSASYYNMGIRN